MDWYHLGARISEGVEIIIETDSRVSDVEVATSIPVLLWVWALLCGDDILKGTLYRHVQN